MSSNCDTSAQSNRRAPASSNRSRSSVASQNRSRDNQIIILSPPHPPTEKRTVRHLVTQLEGQLNHQRSSSQPVGNNYVPKGGVLMALHAQQKTKGTQVYSTKSLLRRCCLIRNTKSSKKQESLAVRLLDESEW